MEALRGWTSGLAIPYFVIDAPGGGGKIPLVPDYVESLGDDEVVLRNFRGNRYVCKQPKAGAAPVRRTDPEYLFSTAPEGDRARRLATPEDVARKAS
jgi:lysine 2,3-aminomutase